MHGCTATRVKFGIVGLGRFGRLHALTAAGLTETELVALVARRQASLKTLSPVNCRVCRVGLTSTGRRRIGAEAWIVACTTAEHVPIARRLLAAGKKVLLEKPISADLTEARSLASVVLPDSRNLMLGHTILFNSEFQQLREEAARRGAITFIDSVRHRPACIVSEFPGENPLHAAMVHDLYLTQVLVGREEPISFQAQCHRTTQGRIDLAVARLQWAGGTIASLTASYLTPEGMPPRGFNRTEVFDDGWCVRIEPNPRPLELWSDQAAWPAALEIRTGEFGPTGMMAEEQRCFCRVVRGLQQVSMGATYADGPQVQRWMDELAALAEHSRWTPYTTLRLYLPLRLDKH